MSKSKFWIFYWTVLIPVAVLIVLATIPFEVVEGLGKVLSALSPIVTVLLAIFGVFVWRLQLVAKRRFELAEEALVNTHAVVYALEAIRSPFSWNTEGRTRKQGENETPDQKEKLDQAFVPFERMNAYADRFSALAKSSLLMEAHFEKAVADNMRVLLAARGRIGNAANMIRMLSDQQMSGATTKTYHQMHAILYATGKRDPDHAMLDDVMTEEIHSARDAIAAELKPYLVEPTFSTLLRIKREAPSGNS
jgi:hypothetical protein